MLGTSSSSSSSTGDSVQCVQGQPASGSLWPAALALLRRAGHSLHHTEVSVSSLPTYLAAREPHCRCWVEDSPAITSSNRSFSRSLASCKSLGASFSSSKEPLCVHGAIPRNFRTSAAQAQRSASSPRLLSLLAQPELSLARFRQSCPLPVLLCALQLSRRSAARNRPHTKNWSQRDAARTKHSHANTFVLEQTSAHRRRQEAL